MVVELDGLKDFGVPVLVAVAAGLILAAVLGSVKAWPVIRDLGRFVLPHFIPPAPGQPDVTLPARMQRVEEGAVQVAADLVEHVKEEMQLRKDDMADRASRQTDLDKRLADGDERMGRIEGKLDDVLGGHPEARKR